MRGRTAVLLSVAAMMFLAPAVSPAQDELALSVDKTLGPGVSKVVFEGVLYRIYTVGDYDLIFQVVDRSHHRVDVIPSSPLQPACDVVIQWSEFEPVTLQLESGGTNSWLLGVETGYAEK